MPLTMLQGLALKGRIWRKEVITRDLICTFESKTKHN